jgi:FlaG/FlaF family flagellin (archaellin)
MRRANRKNKGVSTIIAAALIVAMTVIIAVALGATVLQTPTTQKPYQLQLEGWASENANEIRLTHLGGDPVNTDVISIKTHLPTGVYRGANYEVNTVAYWESDYAIISGGGVLQAGDTLVLNFERCFKPETGGYGPFMPMVGEQFIVELYNNGQPITAVTIICQP